MLNDTERKLLRILINQNGQTSRRVYIPELSRLAVREIGQIRKALGQLKEAAYIEWDEMMNFVRVIEGREHQAKRNMR